MTDKKNKTDSASPVTVSKQNLLLNKENGILVGVIGSTITALSGLLGYTNNNCPPLAARNERFAQLQAENNSHTAEEIAFDAAIAAVKDGDKNSESYRVFKQNQSIADAEIKRRALLNNERAEKENPVQKKMPDSAAVGIGAAAAALLVGVIIKYFGNRIRIELKKPSQLQSMDIFTSSKRVKFTFGPSIGSLDFLKTTLPEDVLHNVTCYRNKMEIEEVTKGTFASVLSAFANSGIVTPDQAARIINEGQKYFGGKSVKTVAGAGR